MNKLKLKPREVKEYEARYNGEIVYADRIVRKFSSELKNIGVRDRTVVVILSAHGETLFERKWVADHGGRVYEEQIRVPLMIKFLEKSKRGTRIKHQVQLVDVLPTLLDYLKIDTQIETDGWSLMPLINKTNDETIKRAAFSNAVTESVRLPEIRAPLVEKALISSIRYPEFKLIEYPMKDGSWYQQLFDLSKDPGETKNIAPKKPDRVKELHEQLDQWRTMTGINTRTEPKQDENKVTEKPK